MQVGSDDNGRIDTKARCSVASIEKHESVLPKSRRRFLLVSGVYVRDDSVLLVSNTWGESSDWTLPGGRIEIGESMVGALVREFREETGLQITTIGGVCFVVHSLRASLSEEAIIVAFRIVDAEGTLGVSKDEFVEEASFFELNHLEHAISNPSNLLPLQESLREDDGKCHFYLFSDASGTPSLVRKL